MCSAVKFCEIIGITVLTKIANHDKIGIKMKCPECQSEKLIKYGWKWQSYMDWNKQRSDRKRVQQYRCNDCGRVTIKPLTEDKNA